MHFYHEKYLTARILEDYKGLREKLQILYKEKYLIMRNKVFALSHLTVTIPLMEEFATYFNEYFDALRDFWKNHKIESNVKRELRDSFFKEIIWYVTRLVPAVKNKYFSIYGEGIFNGLSLNFSDFKVSADTINSADYCIGKQVTISIPEENVEKKVVLPVISVAYKGALDMANLISIKRFSDENRRIFPNTKIFVICDYLDIPSNLKTLEEYFVRKMMDTKVYDGIFFLRFTERSHIAGEILYDYWQRVEESTGLPKFYFQRFPETYLEAVASAAYIKGDTH